MSIVRRPGHSKHRVTRIIREAGVPGNRIINQEAAGRAAPPEEGNAAQ